MSKKNDATALHHLGLIAYWRGDLAKAEELIGKSLKIQPTEPEAHNNLGNVLKDQRRFEEAEARYREAIRQRADNPDARMNLAHALAEQGRLDEAERVAQDGIRQQPDDPEALFNLAKLLSRQRRYGEAIEVYRQALSHRAVFPEALVNLGSLLKNQGALAEAEACNRLAAEQRPGLVEAHHNIGVILAGRGKYAEAEAAYKRALAANPSYAAAYRGLGYVHQDVDALESAAACFVRSLRLMPDNADALSGLIIQQRRLCLWQGLPENEERMRAMVRTGAGPASPFIFIAQSSTAEEQLLCARTWAAGMDLSPSERLPVRPVGDGRPVRIGYLSGDFHEHATAYLTAELFERHDRTRFEIVGYSYGPAQPSAMRTRLEAAFDRFVEVRARSNPEIAGLIHQDEVDILVDLKGYTKDARPEILAYRPAPVQVHFLGFPGTLGTGFVDYLIADPFIAPMEHQPHYAERLVHMPEAYQPNDTRRPVADHGSDRAACGLPDEGFVFCAFNGLYKVTPAVFAVWTRLLKAVPDSVLWLLDTNGAARENLRREASAAGVDPARLVFSPMVPLAEHLARHRHADLFLDTLPVNAHTTASDALWTGLPVLTCAGDAFSSRVAGSLVTAAGLPELVVSSLEEYEATALRLAGDPVALSALRRRLERNRPTSPLFDIARFTAHLEDAFVRMWEIARSGDEPQAFAVPPRPNDGAVADAVIEPAEGLPALCPPTDRDATPGAKMFERCAIYQINLDHRVDRWEQCEANHAAMGFADCGVQRVSAVPETQYGALGCTKSHVKCLTRFLTEDTRDLCMVLEDDFDFRVRAVDLADMLRRVEESGIDWDVLVLATSKINAFGTDVPGLHRVFESLTTAGYIVRRRYVPRLMACFVDSLMALERYRAHTPRDFIVGRFACDVLWQSLQRTDNWFIPLPVPGGQRASYSDVEERFADYNA